MKGYSVQVIIDEIDSEEYVGALDDFAIPLRSKLSDPDRRVVLATVFALEVALTNRSRSTRDASAI